MKLADFINLFCVYDRRISLYILREEKWENIQQPNNCCYQDAHDWFILTLWFFCSIWLFLNQIPYIILPRERDF